MPNTFKVLYLSSKHLEMGDQIALAELAANDGWPTTIKTPYGWYLHASEDAKTDPWFPPNLGLIVRYARANGCSYVEFDAGADVDLGLVTFQAENAVEEV